MLQAGNYHGHLKSGVTGTAKSGGLQVVLQFAIDNYHTGTQWQPVPPANRTVYLSLSDNAWPYTEKKLNALGFNGDFTNPQFSPDASEQGVGLICRHEPHNGQTNEKWDLADWGVQEVKKAPDDQLRRLNALWKKNAGSPAPAGRPTPPPSRPAAPAAAPQRQAPPPPSSPSRTPEFRTDAPPAEKPWDKDRAWDEFCAANSGAPDLTAWNAFVGDVEKEAGKAEAAFGSDEWKRVADVAGIPF